ncbi:DUF2057 domain-containing protein [Ferrimonas sediminicola]|uniref:DUF2057 domain-containing protein n=1 Tax=Ferrimonas sediminicola TaxID=2569538 RepID=A0A4U1BJH8_9GAMM|nr:DUF2057 family protein [Ferrimonas sediminicola]TKB51342.1 DUF2057 domain-containing protein [Ferrimonas sediminicola]
MRLRSLATLATTLLLTAAASASSLHLPKGFYATNVNGNPVSAFDATLNLEQGKQVVTLRYANPYRVHPEHHEMVVSAPIYVVFEVDGSSSYRLNADLPMALNRAKAFAHNPKFDIQRNGQTVAHQAYLGQGAVAKLLSE